jgi:hypothetical protein
MNRLAKSGLVAAIAGFAALGVVHRWPDEAPLAATQVYRSFLTPAPAPRSWFLGAYGFLSGGDIFAGGARVVAALSGSATHAAQPSIAVPGRLASCARATPTCTDVLSRGERVALLASARTLLGNYLALQTATEFTSAIPPRHDITLPPFGAILAAQQLLHAALLDEPDAGQALRSVDEDLAYWRRVLAGSNVLGSSMAAVRGASRALLLRGRLLEGLDESALRRLAPVPALTRSEWSVADAIRFEMAIDYAVLQDLDQFLSRPRGPAFRQGPVVLLPFKPHATFNRHQQDHAAILALAEMPAAEFARTHAALPRPLHAVTWRDRLLNGRGVWLLQRLDGTALFAQYIFAVHDLEAQLALINLEQQLLAGRSEGISVQQRLIDSRIRNPYDPQEAASWDRTTSMLSFASRPGDAGPVRLPLQISMPESYLVSR